MIHYINKMSFKNKSATKNKDILLRKTKKLVKNLEIKILGKINKNLFQNVIQTLNLFRQPVNILTQLFYIIR